MFKHRINENIIILNITWTNDSNFYSFCFGSGNEYGGAKIYPIEERLKHHKAQTLSTKT